MICKLSGKQGDKMSKISQLNDLLIRIFKEENEQSCNYLKPSKFWNRFIGRDGCTDWQYSKPNIANIVIAINRIYSRKDK